MRSGLAAVSPLWMAVLYFWALPLLWPRGVVWGVYDNVDVLGGITVGCLAVCASVVMARPRQKRQHLAFAILVVTCSSLATVFLADVVYALWIRGGWKANYWLDLKGISRAGNRGDPELGWMREPGLRWTGRVDGREIHYRTDENGFRNPPDIDRADLVFIGDSFTEGPSAAEQDTFPRLVEQATGLRTANLGLGGFSPPQELIVLRRYGLPLQPRFVIWQIFEGNDLDNTIDFRRWEQNPNQASLPLWRRYIRKSLIRKSLMEFLSLAKWWTTPARITYPDGASYDTAFWGKPAFPAPDLPAYRDMKDTIQAGYRGCQAQRVELIVLFIPAMQTALEPYITLRGGNRRAEPAWPNLGAGLAEFCAELGCPYIDMLPVFRRAAANNNRHIYLLGDQHLDRDGHRLVAEAVIGRLR